MTLTRRSLAVGLTAMTLPLAAFPAAAQPHPRRPWPGGARAAVSLTYDDSLTSQLYVVAPELAARDLKATFYITRDNMDDHLADWRALARRGHEIANHSLTHPCEVAGYTPERFYESEIAPMERYLDANFGPGPHNWAYPCGFTQLGAGPGRLARALAYKRIVARSFASGRIVSGGPNDPREVRRDRARLHAFEPTWDRDHAGAARRYLDRAAATGGWAILVFHAVVPERRAEGETSIAVHRQILDAVTARRQWCAPVRDVLARIDADPIQG